MVCICMPLRRDALRGFHGLRPWPVEKLFQYSGSPCETCLVHKTLTGGGTAQAVTQGNRYTKEFNTYIHG